MHSMYQRPCRHRCPHQCTSRNVPCTSQCTLSPCPGLVATVLVHGGAGTVADEYVPAIKKGIKLAARIGYATLRSTGSVVDAVQEAVGALEMDPSFNAGYGSVLTWDGKVEMDAAIMNGENLDAGCVSIARDVLHPVALARRVMEKTRHKYLAGDGLMAFAVEENFDILPENSLVTPKSLKSLEDYKASLNFSASPMFGRPAINNNLPSNHNSSTADSNAPATITSPAASTTSNAGARPSARTSVRLGNVSASSNVVSSLPNPTETKMAAVSSGETSSPETLIASNPIPRLSTPSGKATPTLRENNSSMPQVTSSRVSANSRQSGSGLRQGSAPPFLLITSSASPQPHSMEISELPDTPTDVETVQSATSAPSNRRGTAKQRNKKKRSKELRIEYGSPGTVGAVAIDEYGNVAAATSTGGITGKMPGRIGDSPILGGGTYADNQSGCISSTGQGETIMRYNVASRILALIKYTGMGAQQASATVLDEMLYRFNQTAGVITIDRDGHLGIYFTSHRMSWAYQRGRELHYGIEKTDDIMEIVGEPRIEDFGCFDN